MEHPTTRDFPRRTYAERSRFSSFDIFISRSNPKLDFLDCLKAVAERAELNPEDFWLHKVRATFATRCLWAGVDLRTVQQWLGHSDMESTCCRAGTTIARCTQRLVVPARRSDLKFASQKSAEERKDENTVKRRA